VIADMRARVSGGIQRERGAALPTRGRVVPTWTEGVSGERTTSSRLADECDAVIGNTIEMGLAAVDFPRVELRRRPPLGTSSIGSQRHVRRAIAPLGHERLRVFMLLCIYIYANVNRCLRHIFQSMDIPPSIIYL
jgi:hypothetical protein